MNSVQKVVHGVNGVTFVVDMKYFSDFKNEDKHDWGTKNIDNISTTDENNSQPKKSIANKHVKNKENSEITFGKQICENTANSTRILYQNTSSLSLTGSAHPLKEICNCMPTWNLDTCCLVETNTHWKHRKLKENY